jgi:hypothetical protein
MDGQQVPQAEAFAPVSASDEDQSPPQGAPSFIPA